MTSFNAHQLQQIIVKWLPQSKQPLAKTQAFTSTAVEFIEKLAAHFPDEYEHLVYYAGLYAPVYRKTHYQAAKKHFDKLREKAGMLERLRNYAPMVWAKLKEIVSGLNPLKCPHCGGNMIFRKHIFLKRSEIELVVYKNYQILPKPSRGPVAKRTKEALSMYCQTTGSPSGIPTLKRFIVINGEKFHSA